MPELPEPLELHEHAPPFESIRATAAAEAREPPQDEHPEEPEEQDEQPEELPFEQELQ